MKTQTTIRVDESNYQNAKDILAKLGLSYSQAIGLFNSLIVMHNGLPFDVRIPTPETKEALDQLRNKEGKSFDTIDELFDDLDN